MSIPLSGITCPDVVGLKDDSGVRVNPSTADNQTNGEQKTQIVMDGNDVGVQYPFQVDGDSVYCKDVWIDQSITTNWDDVDATGLDIACIPFTNLHTRIENTTSDNPKELLIHFNRTVFATQVGLGCVGAGESFSNIKIIALGSGGVERVIKDESTDNTKYTSRNLFFSKQELFNAIKIEFHTTDDICLSNITIQKVNEVAVSQVERTTNSLKVMQYSHAEIHSGHHYFYRESHDLSKNATVDHLIVTPDTTRWSHMTVSVETVTSSILLEFFRQTIASNNGTLQDSFNRNQNFPDNNTTEIYQAPTITDVGESMLTTSLGAGKNQPGASARDSEEILLKQNTKYLLRITENATVATDTKVNITFDWYEHQNKDEPQP